MHESAINEFKKGNKIKHTHSHTSQILPFVKDKKDIVLYFDPSTAKYFDQNSKFHFVKF